jgi:hypothetical protein
MSSEPTAKPTRRRLKAPPFELIKRNWTGHPLNTVIPKSIAPCVPPIQLTPEEQQTMHNAMISEHGKVVQAEVVRDVQGRVRFCPTQDLLYQLGMKDDSTPEKKEEMRKYVTQGALLKPEEWSTTFTVVLKNLSNATTGRLDIAQAAMLEAVQERKDDPKETEKGDEIQTKDLRRVTKIVKETMAALEKLEKYKRDENQEKQASGHGM